MRTSLMGFFEQAERHQLRLEIVLVDWNPPAGRPLLKDLYVWPSRSRFTTIRTIVVPSSIHRRYEGWQKIPIHFNAAQNVAIRRASGTFVLSTCVDNLLSDELVRFLASEKLEEHSFYRTDRCNVQRDVLQRKSLDEQLAYCRDHIIGVDRFCPEQVMPGVEGAPGLFTGAPGDFTLMHRKYWHKVRGYPEMDIFGRASGSLLCYMAHLAGAKAVALEEPMRLYHMDHDLRTRSPESNWWARARLRQILPAWLAEALKRCVRRVRPARDEIARRNIPHMSPDEAASLIADMVQGRRSFICNDENWGLGAQDLDESVVVTSEGSLVS